jgi:hypothetical protein
MTIIYPSQLQGTTSIDVAINQGKLLDRVFRVKDTGINSKIFHTWKMAGILSTVDPGKWADLSFIEYLWLCTLESMRKFGCSLKLMKAIHEELFVRAYSENLGKKTLEENITFLKNLSKVRPLNNNEVEYLYHCENVFKDPYLLLYLEKEITYFYQLVVKCFTNNGEIGIIIFEDQTFNTYQLVTNATEADENINRSKPHILIPISHYIKQFVAAEEKEQFLVKTGLLNRQEYEVMNQIRNKNVKEITIKFTDADHRIQRIDATESGIITGEKAKEIKQILGLKNYAGIELHTRDGMFLSFTRTTKIITQ